MRLPRYRFHASCLMASLTSWGTFVITPAWSALAWQVRRVSSVIFVLRCRAPPPLPIPHHRSGTRQNQRNTCESKSQKRASVSQRHYGNHPNEIPALDWSIQAKAKFRMSQNDALPLLRIFGPPSRMPLEVLNKLMKRFLANLETVQCRVSV